MPRSAALPWLPLILAVEVASAQVQVAPDVRLHPPRDFGYFTGDLLEWSVSVTVPRGFSFDPRSLHDTPWPDWLELRQAAWEVKDAESTRRVDARFVAQIFVAPTGVTRLGMPDRTLRFHSHQGDAQLRAAIPGFSFTLSALTDSTSTLAPDWPVPRPSTAWIRISAGSLMFLLALWGAAVALERRRARRLLFAHAHHEVHRARDCGQAILVLHRALERKAGRALFGHELRGILEAWPAAGALGGELERFFQISEALFYGNHGAQASPECLRWVQDFAERLRDLERRSGDGRDAARGRPGRTEWTSRDRRS